MAEIGVLSLRRGILLYRLTELGDAQKWQAYQCRPVVHENVRLPQKMRRYANILNASIFTLVPRQTVVFPFLQIPSFILPPTIYYS